MSFYLLHSEGQSLLATDQPLIKACDRDRIADATELLERLDEIDRERRRRAGNAETEARHRGYAEGFAKGRGEFAAAIVEAACQTARHRAAEEEKIASLALAAVRQMVGVIEDEALMAGIAQRAVAAIVSSGPVVVEVSPAMQPLIEQTLGGNEEESVTINADPLLDDHQCRIVGADGRIIADLDVQIAGLAARWGLRDVA